MIVVLVVIALLLILLFLVSVALIDLSRGYRKVLEAQHTYCVSAISEFTSDKLIAQFLRSSAERWDGIDIQPLLRKLADERYQVGGPSMPAIWMNYEADRIDPKHDFDTCPHEHTFAGECQP